LDIAAPPHGKNIEVKRKKKEKYSRIKIINEIWIVIGLFAAPPTEKI